MTLFTTLSSFLHGYDSSKIFLVKFGLLILHVRLVNGLSCAKHSNKNVLSFVQCLLNLSINSLFNIISVVTQLITIMTLIHLFTIKRYKQYCLIYIS